MNAIRTRSSIRKYNKDVSISKEQIEQLLNAAMHAPSAANTRPWEFLVVTNREKLLKITEILKFAQMLKEAPLAIIVCGLPETQTGPLEGFFPQDCAAATQNILLEAAELGLGSCWCGAYPKLKQVDELRVLFDLPQNIVPFNVIAIGVPNEHPKVKGFYEPEKVRYFE